MLVEMADRMTDEFCAAHPKQLFRCGVGFAADCVVIEDQDGKSYDSGLVMYPAGHARNTTANLKDILNHKFKMLGSLGLPDGADVQAFVDKLESLGSMSASGLATVFDAEIAERPGYE